MPAKEVKYDKFVSEMCRQSYYQFFLEFWPTIAAERLVNAWYIKEACDELQLLAERVFLDKAKEYDLIWNCPPGTTKSSLFSVLLQPWVWTRMPSARFITGSYAEKLALDLSRKSRDVVKSDKYKALFPEVQLRDDQDAKGYFVTTKGGMRYATGVGGSVMGMHAHFIVIDDPIDPLGVLSDLVLAEANTWMNETLSNRKVDKLLTPTAIVMQRLHQDDPTGNKIESGQRVKHVCLPCDTNWQVLPVKYRDRYIDGLLDPDRLPRSVLDDALITLGEFGFAGQFGQSPVPRGGAMFKVDRLIYDAKIPSEWKRGPVRYWDKAGTQGGGAYTAGVKMATDKQDRIWILNCVRGQWDSGIREKIILETAQADGRTCRVGIEQEPGASGKESAQASATMLALKGFRCTIDRATGDKELRADPLSTMVNTGNCTIVPGIWNKAFVSEMRFFPRSKYKDQIDAASGAFAVLTKTRYKIGAL